MFLVRKEQQSGPCQIFYTELSDEMRKEEKWEWFRVTEDLSKLSFREIHPDKKYTWLEQGTNEFDSLLPLVGEQNALFTSVFNGVSTNRDEWVYDESQERLGKKLKYFINEYNRLLSNRDESFGPTLKWRSSL